MESENERKNGKTDRLIIDTRSQKHDMGAQYVLSEAGGGSVGVRVNGELEGLVGIGKLPKLARDVSIAVDVDLLDKVVDLARDHVEDDLDRFAEEGRIPDYSIDDSIEALDELRDELEKAADKRDDHANDGGSQ